MAVENVAYAPIQDSAGTQTNPTAAGAALADTGVLPAAMYRVHVVVGCTVAAKFSVQHRNAANSGDISDPVIVRVPAGASIWLEFKYPINVNERIRVLPAADITGDAEAAVSVFRIG